MTTVIKKISPLVNVLLFLALILSPVPFISTTTTYQAPTSVMAQTNAKVTQVNPPTSEDSILTKDEQVINVFKYALTQAANIFWILALILVIYSAYLYLTSGGDKAAVTTARSYLMYAIIAMAVAIVSYGLPQFIKSVLKSAVQ
jgi:hypothetical protein